MADPTDLWLTIGGWTVASIVTLVGVLLAHRFQERSREHQVVAGVASALALLLLVVVIRSHKRA